MKTSIFEAVLITALLLGTSKWSGAQIQETTIRINQDIGYVIPGHGPFGGPELLRHTIELVEKAR